MTKKNAGRTALIDGDIWLYRASAAHEHEIQWEPWLWTLHADLDAAIQQLSADIAQLKEDVGADRVIIALSDSENFRKQILPTYKFNRIGKRKPTCFKALRQYVEESYETFCRPGLEADDVLGILATSKKNIPGEKVIVSIDKDLRTIPGLHLNLSDEARPVITVTEHEANYLHLRQTLTGDASDGYSGCPGMGPVSADKLLTPLWGAADDGPFFPVELVWPHVVAAYEKKGLSEAVALQMAQVARICRVSDYDFTNKRVIPWTP